jgi:hypothetical protein
VEVFLLRYLLSVEVVLVVETLAVAAVLVV